MTTKTLFAAVLFSALAAPAPGQTARPRAGQAAPAAAQQVARAWSAFAEGRSDEAASLAEQAAAASTEFGHDATGLLIRIEAGRDRVKPALGAYDRWLRRSGRDDRFLLHPIGRRLLDGLSRSNDPALRAAATARLIRSGAAIPPGNAGDMTAVAGRAEGGDPAAQQQLAQMASADSASVRVGTVKALAAGGAASVPQLSALLGHRAPDVRAAAAEALGVIGGAPAAAALRKAQQDPDPYVRLRVTVALARAGDQDALAAANAALASPVADIRVTAAEAFEDNPTDASRSALRSALSDANPLTRAHAAALLGGGEDSTRTLIELLNSDNPTVREEAAKVVEDRLEDNLPLIRSLLESADPWLQLYGAGALLAPSGR